jgi:hypothetical protein
MLMAELTLISILPLVVIMLLAVAGRILIEMLPPAITMVQKHHAQAQVKCNAKTAKVPKEAHQVMVVQNGTSQKSPRGAPFQGPQMLPKRRVDLEHYLQREDLMALLEVVHCLQ